MADKKFTPQLETSAAQSFFLGSIVEENFFPYPAFASEEAANLGMVVESIDKFMQGRDEEYRRHDVKGEQPDEYIQALRDLGLFGLIIPQQFEGLGFSNASYSRILQQTSRYDSSTSLTIGAHSSIGMKGLILFGTPEQKQKYLPRLASGELIAAFCLTEPGSGSDAASIKTAASKNADGSWTLNGEKIWITNGPLAGFFTVLARTDTSDGKISAFIVERGYPGVSVGPKEDKMGIRASATSTVRFDNVRLPAESLLGQEGKGFKVAMAILNNGRTGLGGGCVGGMKRCIQLASAQVKDRKQFGRSIIEFDLVKEKLAQMTINCFAAESAVNLVAHLIDAGSSEFSVEAAITKVFASEALWETAFDALQLAGGSGFMREFPYERVVRDSRINLIYEGTNEILRLYIALTGMKDAGEYLKEIGKGASKIFNDPIKGFGVLSDYASKRFSQLTSLGGDTIDTINPLLKDEGKVFELYVLRLSKAADEVLKRLGKNVIGSQLVSKRIANVAIDLFVGLSLLSRVSAIIAAKGEDRSVEERTIARAFTQQAKRRMSANLRRLERNEDAELKSLADAIAQNGSYPWDVF